MGKVHLLVLGGGHQSNGEPIILEVGKKIYQIGHIKGDLIRIGEWYGWNGEPNKGVYMLATDIAEGIRMRQRKWNIDERVRAGPADTQIFSNNDEPTETVAGKMSSRGVKWTHADKGKGSRNQGWQMIRERLMASKPDPDGTRSKPGIFVCERCEQSQRIIPELPRDNKDLDDVDTACEDHIGDEWRYRVRRKKLEASRRSF